MNTNLKPFNLERALAGDPVVTRDGRSVQQIFHFDKSELKFPLVIYIPGSGGTETRTIKGKTTYSIPHESANDLFMAPIEKEYWMASGKAVNYCNEIVCTRLCNTESEIGRLVLGTGLLPETIQFHKITRLE